MRTITLAPSLVLSCFFSVALLGPPEAVVRAQAYRSPSAYGAPGPYTAAELILSAQAETIKAQAMAMQSQAALIKARYDALKTTADSMESLQKARSLKIDNDLKAARTYYDRRVLREGYMAAQQHHSLANALAMQQAPSGAAAAAKPAAAPLNPAASSGKPGPQPASPAPGPSTPASTAPPTPPATPPARIVLSSYAKSAAPDRLHRTQLDANRGAIRWPAVFRDPSFAAPRAQMDALFGSRQLTDVGPTTQFYHDVHKTAVVMREILRSKAAGLTSAESIAARRFLESLAYEALRAPMLLENVASNP